MAPTISFLFLEAHFEGGDVEGCVGVAEKIQKKKDGGRGIQKRRYTGEKPSKTWGLTGTGR